MRLRSRPRRLAALAPGCGASVGISDEHWSLSRAENCRAAVQSYANFIVAADNLAATRDGSELEQTESPRRCLHPVSTYRTLNLLEEKICTIIWANGYGYSYDWVKLPIVDAKGAPVQQRGVTVCPGVYFLGLHWMHTFRSAILPFVGRDASYLADHIDHLAL